MRFCAITDSGKQWFGWALNSDGWGIVEQGQDCEPFLLIKRSEHFRVRHFAEEVEVAGDEATEALKWLRRERLPDRAARRGDGRGFGPSLSR